MDPELKQQLEETRALTKDNNRMLHAIRRGQWLGLVGKIVFWAIILLVPLYIYQQYLQPIVSRFYPTSSTGTSSTFGIFGFPTTADLQKLINSYKAK
jgi:hypothetical protein